MRTQPLPGAGSAEQDLRRIRRLAAQRRLSGSRVRRLLPGVIVGTATLAGSGALISWVGGQPGLVTTSTPATLPTRASAPTTADAVGSLTRQLAADEAEVRSLDQTMAHLAEQEAAAASAPPDQHGPAPDRPAGAVPAPLPTIPPIQPVTISPAPAPATNATTGASHAVK